MQNSMISSDRLSPFSVLGVQNAAGRRLLRVNAPGAWRVEARCRSAGDLLAILDQSQTPGLFAAPFDSDAPYLLRIYWPGRVDEHEDPYSFPPALSASELQMMRSEPVRGVSDLLGAHPAVHGGVNGVRFALWSPGAASVSVVGDFNGWSDRRHPMGPRDESGVWELFVPRVSSGARYCFAVREHGREDASLIVDPFACVIETAPRLAATVEPVFRHDWRDERFLAIRRARRDCAAPVAIYRIEPDAWLGLEGRVADWRTMGERLPGFVSALGFTHVQIGLSKKIGPTWIFAPPPTLGDAGDFASFVDFCHDAGLGVIIEWDAADAYSDARAAEANVLVENILTDSAMRWIEDFHIDGLSMRTPQRAPNLLARLKHEIDEKAPGVLLMLEDGEPGENAEAVAWRTDAIFAAFDGDAHLLQQESAKRLEKSLLPFTPHSLSHFAAASDGDDPLALLRAVYAMAWLTPGMKLIHMGAELGQHTWPDGAVAWDILDDPRSLCFLKLVRDLNSTLRNEAPIRLTSRVSQLVTWLPTQEPVIAYIRSGDAAAPLLVAMNRAGEPRHVRLEAPCGGFWRELLNTDSRHYGGADVGNCGGVHASENHGVAGAFWIDITLPPRGAIIFRNDT
jgi:1,4-alpha-glucan branching enzyme